LPTIGELLVSLCQPPPSVLIEGDDSEQLVALRAGKIELRGKELLLRFENLLIAGFAGHVNVLKKA
jgi:hypothetical protein